MTFNSIGKVVGGESPSIEVDPEYIAGLTGLQGFSHLIVLWCADKVATWSSAGLLIDKPYRLAPPKLGVFATRSPFRPNNICVSVATIASIDEKKGLVKLWWIDAEDGTPIIDMKPYHPSLDKVRDVRTPEWCSAWPDCLENSAGFAWEKEFLFR